MNIECDVSKTVLNIEGGIIAEDFLDLLLLDCAIMPLPHSVTALNRDSTPPGQLLLQAGTAAERTRILHEN